MHKLLLEKIGIIVMLVRVTRYISILSIWVGLSSRIVHVGIVSSIWLLLVEVGIHFFYSKNMFINSED